jgi:hypothetical protein
VAGNWSLNTLHLTAQFALVVMLLLLLLLLLLLCTLLQGKVATAARESKGNFFIKLGKQLVNNHKKIFKVKAAARLCSSASQRTAL